MRVLTFTLPLPPNLANGRMHWWDRVKGQRNWQWRALVAERRLHGRPEPMARARVTAVFYVKQVMDDDNAVARLKWALDLLKVRRFILDDRRPHLELTGIPEQHVDHKAPRLELRLEEVA